MDFRAMLMRKKKPAKKVVVSIQILLCSKGIGTKFKVLIFSELFKELQTVTGEFISNVLCC